jgi:predicted trehalose synthase
VLARHLRLERMAPLRGFHEGEPARPASTARSAVERPHKDVRAGLRSRDGATRTKCSRLLRRGKNGTAGTREQRTRQRLTGESIHT